MGTGRRFKLRKFETEEGEETAVLGNGNVTSAGGSVKSKGQAEELRRDRFFRPAPQESSRVWRILLPMGKAWAAGEREAKPPRGRPRQTWT